MGFIGGEIGNEVGGLLGSYIGNKFKNKKSGKKIGELAGKIAGNYIIPFEKGGFVKPINNQKTQLALLHKNELIIPKHLTKHVSKSLKEKIKRGGGRNM